jgi:hypothetical protein
MLEEFIQSKTGIILISVIWGLGLATLFKKSCEGYNCNVIKYQGPTNDDIKHVWKYTNNKCYKFNPYLSECK